jgi:hypothetical protein
MMALVFLDPDGTEDIGLCLVVEAATGVEYGNQCGGVACIQNRTEGYLVPLGQRAREEEIRQLFMRHFGESGYPPHIKWEESIVSELRSIVYRVVCWNTVAEGEDERAHLELDLERLKECIEAWIPVRTPRGNGILMLKNSD